MIGSHSVSSPYGRNGGYMDYDRGFWELGFGDACPQNSDYDRTLGKRYNVKFSTVSGNGYLEVDGNKIITDNSSQSTSSTNVMIFTSVYEKNKGKGTTKAKLYGAKIWSSDGVLVFDLVPAQDIYTGRIGLLDKVSGRFFGNLGTGEFLGG